MSSKIKLPESPHQMFSKTGKSAAIFGIGISLAIYAKITEDLQPLLYFSGGVAIMFIFFVINHILGKLAEQP
ncbi:MAG: hypothetical protein GOV00_00035 [Candidatus Altiarchaeota archaeon]|nr:hypothetical protein [Candidatus Altiarchaeota archaeon]